MTMWCLEKMCNTNQRYMLFFLFVVCFVLVAIQYRFNFSTTTKCFPDDRFVKRVVERVYYEVPRTTKVPPSAASITSTLHPTSREVSTTSSWVSPKSANRQVCTPETHIMFLKTHKTGSSTITNLLNRYADKHNLTILLPVGAGYYSFDWPNKFRLSSAVPVHGKRPNFLANHARYSRKSLNVLFPRDATTYISILRHPVSQWESTFQYMSFPYVLSIMSMEDPMAFFLDNLPATKNIIDVARRYPSAYLIRNPLFFDLGLDYGDYENSTMIRRAVDTLDRDFHLVLIMEHFDESLTLLRRRLCWSIDDVVYFKMNERLNKHKSRVLSEDQIKKIKRWNNADMVLYNYFVEKFWKEISKEGEDFYDDVMALRERCKYYSKICIESEAVEEAYSSVYVKGYKMRTNLTGEEAVFCERMLRNELRYQDYFRTQHTKWVNKLEGITIENFKDVTNEAEVYVDSTKVVYSPYEYGEAAAERRRAAKSRSKEETLQNRKRRKRTGRRYSAVQSSLTLKTSDVKPKLLTAKDVSSIIDELVSNSSNTGAKMSNNMSEKRVSSDVASSLLNGNDVILDGPSADYIQFHNDDAKRYDGKTIMQDLKKGKL